MVVVSLGIAIRSLSHRLSVGRDRGVFLALNARRSIIVGVV